jgi:hypothetical protein
MQELTKEVKVLVIDNLGIVMGNITVKDDMYIVTNPLFLSPSQNGIAMQNNPLFEDELTVSKQYVVAVSNPKIDVIEKYEAYRTQKSTGIIMPPKSKLQL